MLSENTRATGASQAFCTPNSDTHTTRLSRVKDWLEESKRLVTEEAGRNACKIQKVSHRLVCDLAETFARFPSFTQQGELWPAQSTLARQLDVNERQVRRAVAVLVERKVLSIARHSRGRRSDTNTMVALLDGKPLFAEVDNDHRPSASAEYRTPASPKYRATASSNSKEEELKKDSSPVSPSNRKTWETPTTQTCSQAELDPSKGNPRGHGGERAASFSRLLSDYPHPPGQRERPAYEPMARRAWAALSDVRRAAAIDAAPHAPGKSWLGHWLNDARETGIFDTVKQATAGPRVWVSEGTPQHAAWAEHYRSSGRRLPRTQHRIAGELRAGWMFESEWPPNFNFVQSDGRAA
jgi:hypothetical protein